MLAWCDDLLRDLKYGVRMIRSARLISIAVVLTLAIGIGINSGIFTIINGILLRPRTDSDPARFARLYAQYWSHGNPREFFGQFSTAAYRAIEQGSQSLEQLAAWRADRVLIGEDTTASQAMEVSCNFFSVYGLRQPLAGRLLHANECVPGTDEPVAVLSEEAWRDRFAADPEIVGKTILLNRQGFTVVGITPRNFPGRLHGPGIWVPLIMQHRLSGQKDIFVADKTPSVFLEGRLLTGHTREEVEAETNVIVAHLPGADPDLKQRVLVTSGALIEDPVVRQNGFWILVLIITGAMLLVVVSSASGAVLLLSRAVARQQEIAIRISLGAARRRIVRQLLSENLLLAAAAGGLGMYIALELPGLFRKMIPRMAYFPFTLDWHVFGYLAALTLLSAIVAGLMPAFESLKQNVCISLKGHEPTLQAARVRWSLRDLLVIVQVCFCVVLMVVSAMFSQAVLSLFAMEPGFETRHMLAISLELSPDRYPGAEAEGFYRRAEDRIAEIGQVDEVATSSMTPLAGNTEEATAGTQFRLPREATAHSATVRSVSRNYFRTLGIPFLRGDEFPNSEPDDSQVIVSQAFASAFWPRQDAIGQTVISAEGKRLLVVGVVRDNHTGYTAEADGPTIYMLRAKPVRGDLLLVRFHGESQPMAADIRRIVRDLDSQVLALPSTLREQMDENAEAGWLLGKMLLFVAGVAAGLALLGIYGVVGYSVTRRTREFGIRAALGASPRELMRLVFSSGVRPVVAGTVVGTGVAFLFSLAVVNVMREAPLPLSSTGPVPYVAVAACLITAALLAMVGHARRAARIHPLTALREQ